MLIEILVKICYNKRRKNMANGLDRYSKATQETADNLRIIDDVMFRVVAEKKDVCQEMLRTLLDMPHLTVKEVHSQSSVASMHRTITLDALCVLEDGSLGNIEMQKSNSNDDIKRARFHASVLTANFTPKGTDFADIPNVKILYISEYDALGTNQTVTKIGRYMQCGDVCVPVNDGEEIYFANTKVKDGSKKTELLQLLIRRDVFNEPNFPAISKAVKYFKNTEGGKGEMCKIIEDSYKIAYKDKLEELEIKGMELDKKEMELDKKRILMEAQMAEQEKQMAEQEKQMAESKNALAEKDIMIQELQKKLAALSS